MHAVEVPTPYSFAGAFTCGGSLFRERYAPLLGASAVFFALVVVELTIGFVLDATLGEGASDVLTFFTAVFLDGPLVVSWLYAGVAVLRRGTLDGTNLFRGFDRYWRSVGVYVAAMLAGVLLFAPIVGIGFALEGLGRSGHSLGIALFVPLLVGGVLLYLYVLARVTPALLMIVDEHQIGGAAGVVDSVMRSWSAPRGAVGWSLLALGLLCFVILLLSLLLLVLPYLFVGMPLVLAVAAAAYESLQTQRGAFANPATCPKCGYALTGLASPQCPECGTDLTPRPPGAGPSLG